MAISDREIYGRIIKIVDLLMMIISFALASFISYLENSDVSFDEFLGLRIEIHNFGLFLGLMLLWNLIFIFFRLYIFNNISDKNREIIGIFKATFSGTLLIGLVSHAFKI